MKILARIFLIGLGGLMLLGGGFCAASNTFFFVTNFKDKSVMTLCAGLFAIAMLIAWCGFWLLREMGVINMKNTHNHGKVE